MIDDYFEKRAEKEKLDREISKNITHMLNLREYNYAQFQQSEFRKSRAETELLKLQDYETQKQYRDLMSKSNFEKSLGHTSNYDYHRFKAEKILTSLPNSDD